MDEAEIVGREGDHWVVESADGRRYFLRAPDIVGLPRIGQKGRVGYVQRPSAVVMTFVAAKEPQAGD